MKPIKPKPMPKALETWLYGVVTGAANPTDMTKFDARSILAALAYERQLRADMSIVTQAAIRGSMAREEVVTPECQRAFTEAVVPKPRKKKG